MRGAEEGFPRASAMALLAETDYPNVHRDLAAVLLDESDLSRIRTAAAITLWRLGSAEAASVLERSLAVEDERVLARVFTTLGRIGPSTALDAITEARRRTSGFARAQADFAATSIAHRFGLPGHKAVPPATNAFLAVPRAARPFRVSRADAAEAELGLRSLASEPFGIDLSERDAFRLRCDGNDWLLMLNAELSEAGGSLLADRKAVAAVIASKQQETGLYSTKLLVLTAPTPEETAVAGMTCTAVSASCRSQARRGSSATRSSSRCRRSRRPARFRCASAAPGHRAGRPPWRRWRACS